MHGPNTDKHPVSFSAVYVNLRQTDCVYQNTCQNGYFNITLCACMYPSVEALSETRYLNHASLSHSFSLCVCALRCVRQRLSAENGVRANDKLSLYGG